ncbi:DinB family protein [Rhodococcus chondri]|uniref:DinB family protein n=1 Tax=Rhodococcus chondri TaxID=3065941 RepID=A0ABU7JTF8_9NOCA|nr:DinB family protein [Rhodococcus sp. CC-R104]MEE2033311.1 DinB family protein [Rhodococcus sp. CC-R104]
MAITPDVKDWSWVVERACPDCGFDPSAVAFDDIPALVRERLGSWSAVLARPDAGNRPDADTWAPVEYAAHVRDVCRVFRGRLALMLEQEDPPFEDWDQDGAAIADAYRRQAPATVAAELRSAADEAVGAFAAVPEALRGRTGRRGDGARFTVTTLALYFAHEHVHHVWDVEYRELS